MPMFFILAGFFCSLLYSRRTLRGFVISNTVVRLAVPLVVGWALLSPVIGGGAAYSGMALFLGKEFAWDFAWGLLREGELYFLDTTLHLWFLYYLLYFYAAYLIIRKVGERVRIPGLSGAQAGARWLFDRPWRVLLLAAPTIAVLLVQPLREGTSSFSWTPGSGFLLLYGFFFFIGTILFAVREVVDEFKRNAWVLLLAGAVLFAGYSVIQFDQYAPGAEGRNVRLIMTVANGVFIWALFVGSVGVFMRYLNRPIPAVRYIADASYWCYIFHLSFGIWLPGFIADYSWSPEVKFLVVYATMISVSFVAYELFVRWSIIGRVLNGRTYPSGLASQLRRLRGRLSSSPPEPAT